MSDIALGWAPTEEEGAEKSTKFMVEFETPVSVKTLAHILRGNGPTTFPNDCPPLPAVLENVKPVGK